MSVTESLERQAQELSANLNPIRQREQNIESMYNDFISNAEKDTYIKSSEFKKYEALYSDSTRNRLASTEATEEERTSIVALSEEFYHRVNTQRPIHVIDDYSDKELFVLPPIFRRLNNLSTAAHAEATQIFASTFEAADNNSPAAYTRKQIATDNLYRNILSVQDENQLHEDQKQFAKLSAEFHKNYLHDNLYDQQNTSAPSDTSEEVKPTVSSVDDEDYLDFDE